MNVGLLLLGRTIEALKGEGYLCANGLDVFVINGNCIFIYFKPA